MKYRLCDSYRLEGWKNLPTGIYNTETGKTHFLDAEHYKLLLHMDGVEEISEHQLSDSEKEIIRQLIENKVIRSCTSDDPISSEQRYHFYDRTFISYVHWAITGKCNYRCKHCYMYAPLAKFPEPDFEECCKIIEEMKNAGVRSVGLTGGEPLVRPDFLKLADELVSHEIEIQSIYTNGALVTNDLLDELSKRGQNPCFHISLDGISHHDWLRGIPGAKDLAIRAINLCHAHGNEVFAAMCVHRKNQGEILETVNYLASLGVSRTRIKFMLPNGMWTENYESESLNISEATDMIVEFIDKFFASGMQSGVIIDNMFSYNPKQKVCYIPFVEKCSGDSYLCKKAATNPYIGPTGVVLPCMTLGGCHYQDNFPNIFKTPLSQIMDESYYRNVTHMQRKDFFTMHPECRTCAERNLCTTGCRAYTTDDFLDLDSWNCSFLRDGYYRKVDTAIRNALKKYQLENEVNYLCISD